MTPTGFPVRHIPVRYKTEEKLILENITISDLTHFKQNVAYLFQESLTRLGIIQTLPRH